MAATSAQMSDPKVPKSQRILNYICMRVHWFLGLSVEGRCYGIAIVILVISACLAPFKNPEAQLLAQVALLVFVSGLLPLIERLYEWAWQKLLGKLIIAALIALSTNMAYGFGRQMVAELVGTNPEPFTATVNVATILLSPILFLMVLAVGGFVIFAVALYVGIFAFMLFSQSTSPGKWKRACLWFCRLAALCIAVFGSWALVNHSGGYYGWVSRRAAGYLYTFDMYRDAQHSKGKNEKVAVLSDGRLLIGAPREGGGFTFVLRKAEDGEGGAR